ncbi:ATP-binding protein [Ammoniphilus resinae]|nr:ATP-binding protein [Ammoniphilus resinae]
MIFSPLVFYPYVYRAKNNRPLFQILVYILFSLALFTTMLFPLNLNGLIYDFRSIPIIIGSLYGGATVSVLLFITLGLYRFILGNPNNLFYILAVLPSLFMVLYTSKKYSTLRLYQKTIVSVVLCTMMKLMTFTFYFIMIQNLEILAESLTGSLQTYVTQAIIIGVFVYFMETLNKYFHLQDEVYKSERIKTVSEMAASVAHEIRNPLTTVKGFIQLLGEPDIDKEKREYYQKICLEELNRAELIITDYLSIAKPDPEVIENINVNEEISYLSSVLQTYANYYNIKMHLVFSVDPDLHIMGDRYKFRQALINIGKNAIEAMQNGGMLEIKANQVNRNVVLSISDTGVGMSPEQVKRLGTPYYSTKEKGTGLGTMLSFVIIKKMNGKIDIKSKIGKGTEFIFIFPKSY